MVQSIADWPASIFMKVLRGDCFLSFRGTRNLLLLQRDASFVSMTLWACFSIYQLLDSDSETSSV